MRLYLVRHGEAAEPGIDQQRPLTSAGREQTQRVADTLAKQNIRLAEIRHSPKLRAKQTAQILQKTLAPALSLEEDPLLVPEANPTLTEDYLEHASSPLMIVSHFPFLPNLTHCLLANAPPGALAFPTSGAILLERTTDNTWHFIEAITP